MSNAIDTNTLSLEAAPYLERGAAIHCGNLPHLTHEHRWSTSANPEGLLVFVRDGSVVSVISANQTIAKGIV
jgi:hypothetical protein